MAGKPESKREEFRRYLEKAGVLDAMTRVLVSLYEEKERPPNALEYFLDRLAEKSHLKADADALQTEIKELQEKLATLEEENERLRNRILNNQVTQNDDDAKEAGSLLAMEASGKSLTERQGKEED